MSNEELVKQIQDGDRNRLPELWEQVERFVALRSRAVAERLDGRYGVTAEDFYQSGYFALLSALETFAEEKGCSFLSWLDVHLKREFAICGGWRTDRARKDPLNSALSLNAPLVNEEDNDATLGDYLPDPDGLQAFEDVEQEDWNFQLHHALETAIDEIPVKPGDVIRRRYFCGETFAEIASVYGNTPSRIQQIEGNALFSLRSAEAARTLEKFLEINTPYYLRVGVEQFHRTKTSAVEKIALLRERLRQDYFPQERRSIWTSKHD